MSYTRILLAVALSSGCAQSHTLTVDAGPLPDIAVVPDIAITPDIGDPLDMAVEACDVEVDIRRIGVTGLSSRDGASLCGAPRPSTNIHAFWRLEDLFSGFEWNFIPVFREDQVAFNVIVDQCRETFSVTAPGGRVLAEAVPYDSVLSPRVEELPLTFLVGIPADRPWRFTLRDVEFSFSRSSEIVTWTGHVSPEEVAALWQIIEQTTPAVPSTGPAEILDIDLDGDGACEAMTLTMNGRVATPNPAYACQVALAQAPPLLTSRVGLDQDGGGSDVGCGTDGPGGIDNAFAEWGIGGTTPIPFSMALLQEALGADFEGSPDFSLNECGEAPSLTIGSGEARQTFLFNEDRDIFVEAEDMRIDVGMAQGLLATNVVYSGRIEGGALQDLIVSMRFSEADAVRMASGWSFGRFDYFLDIDSDPNQPGCESMSAVFRIR